MINLEGVGGLTVAGYLGVAWLDHPKAIYNGMLIMPSCRGGCLHHFGVCRVGRGKTCSIVKVWKIIACTFFPLVREVLFTMRRIKRPKKQLGATPAAARPFPSSKGQHKLRRKRKNQAKRAPWKISASNYGKHPTKVRKVAPRKQTFASLILHWSVHRLDS